MQAPAVVRAIRMVVETIRKPYEDLAVSCANRHDYEYGFNKMMRVVDGTSIVDVTERFFVY